MELIETDRLRLRQWKDGDLTDVARFFADEDSARYLGGRKDLDQAWRHIAAQIGHWALRGFGHWAVEEKGTGEFVGSVGLWQSAEWPELELGYWLVTEHQGKGYALEAAQRCRDYAREDLKARSLVSYIDARNERSIRLAKRLGAKYEGTIELASCGTQGVFRHF
jgi:RimJ/RimL family protein N-acetyltransferase